MKINKLSKLFLILNGLLPFNTFAAAPSSPFSTIHNALLNFPPLEKKNYVYNYPMIDRYKIKKHYDFKNFVIFGDSLSDVGEIRENRYLAGGYANKMGTELLTLYFTGKETAPAISKTGGESYAWTGAIASDITSTRSTANKQVNNYLYYNKKVDPDNIYYMWLGAMDINIDFLKNPIKAFQNSKGLDYTINDAPNAVVKQAQRLIDMGAKYTMVVNIPDSATAPITSVLYTDGLRSLTSNIPIVQNLVELFVSSQLARVDKYMRNPENRVHINGDKGIEYLKENGIRGMKHLFLILPDFAVRFLYQIGYDLQSDLTRQFSYSLNKGLEEVDGPIVYIDFRKANYELLENPQKYGFEDIISPVCTLGYSAKLCDVDSPKYHKDRVYLTSDWFHPSPYANKLLADYVISIFDGPMHVSSITRQQKIITDMRHDFIQEQLDILRNNENNELQKIIPLFGYSSNYNLKERSYMDTRKNYTQNFNLGLAYYLNENSLIGGLFNLGYGKFLPYDNYNYHYNNQSLSLFTENKFNKFWVNTDINIGRLSASNITRIISLGPIAKEYEYGSTSGNTYGLDVFGGYTFKTENNINHGPVVGFSMNRFKTKAYRENDDRSAAMHFEPENFKFDYISLGWKLNTTNNPIANLSLEANINKRFSKKPLIVNGAINSTKTSFFREYKYNNDWINVKAGINKDITKNTNLSFQIGYSGNYRHNQNRDIKNVNLTIGLHSSF